MYEFIKSMETLGSKLSRGYTESGIGINIADEAEEDEEEEEEEEEVESRCRSRKIARSSHRSFNF